MPVNLHELRKVVYKSVEDISNATGWQRLVGFNSNGSASVHLESEDGTKTATFDISNGQITTIKDVKVPEENPIEYGVEAASGITYLCYNSTGNFKILSRLYSFGESIQVGISATTAPTSNASITTAEPGEVFVSGDYIINVAQNNIVFRANGNDLKFDSNGDFNYNGGNFVVNGDSTSVTSSGPTTITSGSTEISSSETITISGGTSTEIKSGTASVKTTADGAVVNVAATILDVDATTTNIDGTNLNANLSTSAIINTPSLTIPGAQTTITNLGSTNLRTLNLTAGFNSANASTGTVKISHFQAGFTNEADTNASMSVFNAPDGDGFTVAITELNVTNELRLPDGTRYSANSGTYLSANSLSLSGRDKINGDYDNEGNRRHIFLKTADGLETSDSTSERRPNISLGYIGSQNNSSASSGSIITASSHTIIRDGDIQLYSSVSPNAGRSIINGGYATFPVGLHVGSTATSFVVSSSGELDTNSAITANGQIQGVSLYSNTSTSTNELVVRGNATIDKSVIIRGNGITNPTGVTLNIQNGGLFVKGEIDTEGNISGNRFAAGNLSTAREAAIGSNLNVANFIYIYGNTPYTSGSNSYALYIAQGNAYINNTLTVTGLASAGSFSTSGATSTGTLTTSGTASIGSTLTVTGGGVAVTGDSTFTDNVAITGNLSIEENISSSIVIANTFRTRNGSASGPHWDQSMSGNDLVFTFVTA